MFSRQALRTIASRAAASPGSLRSYSATSNLQDRVVVAVGGNALQRRGDRLTIENMLKAAAEMAPTIATLHNEHEVVLCHGNGPQVGELALERSNATFDVLGAESMGQIGYVLAQAMASQGVNACPIICQVVVDAQSDAFKNPTKFVGPVYGSKEAHALGQSLGASVGAAIGTAKGTGRDTDKGTARGDPPPALRPRNRRELSRELGHV